MSLLTAVVIATTLLFTFPSTAMAHLVTTGLGPFYEGGMHLLLSPGDLLGLVAAVMLGGLQGARAARLVAIVLPAAWYTAGLIGLYLPVSIDLPWLRVFSFVILGILVAVNPKLSPSIVTLMAGLYGVLHGLLNGSALAVVGTGCPMIIGIAVTVLITSLLCSAWIVSLQAAWTRLAVRVMGSWITAVGMLMLGWMVRGQG